MKKVALSFVAVAAMTASVAQAAPKTEGAYVFGNYTHANLKTSNMKSDWDNYHSQSKNAFGLGGGYQFNENFALEAGYKGLGKEQYADREANDFYDYSDTTTVKASAFILRAIGILPVTNGFALEGSIGAALASQKVTNDFYNYSKHFNKMSQEKHEESSSRSIVIPAIGVGATYAINDDLTAFARYEYIALPKIEDIKMKSHSVDIGLRYHF